VAKSAVQSVGFAGILLGRDDRINSGEKPMQIAHIKMFRAPWQIDYILLHMTDQHPDQFKTYSELPHERKKEYFPDEGSSPSRPDSALISPAAPSISARFF
jgi:hypothetical protein